MKLDAREKKLWIFFACLMPFLGLLVYLTFDNNKYTDEELGIEKNFEKNLVEELNRNKESEPVFTSAIQTSTEVQNNNSNAVGKIKNIALFGVDSRSLNEKGSRADSIIVLTINYETEEIKMTSFMRDMLVNIDGKGQDKLNHSHAYGGPKLAMKTLNENFGLNIDDYITVNFFSLSKIIDKLDGVEISLDSQEVNLINQYIKEVESIEGKVSDVKSSGLVVLNGAQAVAYSRIRDHGNGDYERTERQRTVLSAIVKRIENASLVELTSLAKFALENTDTSLSLAESLTLAKDYKTIHFSSPQKERIPREGSYSTGIQKNGMWAMKVDLLKEKEYLRKWIYSKE